MPGLIDIMPLRETVTIQGVKITVRGISITTIGTCLAESEDLQRFWAGRKFDPVNLLATLPKTVSRIVATAIIEDASGGDPVRDVINGFAGEPGEGDYYQPPAELTARLAAAATAAATERDRQISMNAIAFDELNGDDQLSLVEAVVRCSFPGGLSPFVDRLGKLAGRDSLTGALRARFGKARDTSSPQQ